jgi:hypothetical protein
MKEGADSQQSWADYRVELARFDQGVGVLDNGLGSCTAGFLVDQFAFVPHCAKVRTGFI